MTTGENVSNNTLFHRSAAKLRLVDDLARDLSFRQLSNLIVYKRICHGNDLLMVTVMLNRWSNKKVPEKKQQKKRLRVQVLTLVVI